jgi:pimeloyl-ACP methyl ester carboxylesterase
MEIPVAGQAPILAYLVRPDRPAHRHSLAGALYLHWFEPPGTTQNRTEFLAEAVDLARCGAVAILPQLSFPWNDNPTGTPTDRTLVERQLAAVVSAYNRLEDLTEVNPHRTAVVGHDYGAMYGALLAQRDPRVRASVFMAGDATWSNWVDTYWLDRTANGEYGAVFAGLDPVGNVSRLGPRQYFQWAGRDRFVPASVRDSFAAANPDAVVSLYDSAGHSLHEPARSDRAAFVRAALNLP